VADATGELTPAGLRDELAPFGTIIKIHRGVVVPTIAQNVAIFDVAADWNTGTRSGTSIAENGDPVLGNIQEQQWTCAGPPEGRKDPHRRDRALRDPADRRCRQRNRD
jgi:hypothetical protein